MNSLYPVCALMCVSRPLGSYTFPISFSQAIDFLLLSLLLQNTLKLFHSKVKLPNATRHNKGIEILCITCRIVQSIRLEHSSVAAFILSALK
ncbi:hypothetical protein EB796_003883 [Bugula neritina]|uniref:Uncharacterized protein n=1 Tax=Bugula neritina TaxID=10212 RepID=A0A7J7KGU5_BUGNE|nr:hypothetical protein EB796_003883 [Bugula neritina]